MIATHDPGLDVVIVEDPKEKKDLSEEKKDLRCPIEEQKMLERYNYYRNGGHLGPTGHGDICYSDADPGL